MDWNVGVQSQESVDVSITIEFGIKESIGIRKSISSMEIRSCLPIDGVQRVGIAFCKCMTINYSEWAFFHQRLLIEYIVRLMSYSNELALSFMQI